MKPLSMVARVVASVAHLALVLLIMIRAGGGSGSLVALPLLFAMPGILRGRAYTYSWACMLVVFYVAGYLAGGYFEPARKWEFFGMASVGAVDFVALVLYVRLLARETMARQHMAGG